MNNIRHVYYFLLLLPLFVSGQTTSIYDIQYTTNPGNGTYPSPLEGQYVTAGGIVTAYGYNDDNYFISSSAGGAWNGIFIYDNDYYPNVGDSIVIQGLVYEYNGFTEIKDIGSFNVISSGNTLPPSAIVSTNNVFNQEAYEGVFVEVNNVQVSHTYDEWNEWQVDDGSGSCIISYGIFSLEAYGFPLFIDYPFSKITGLVSYSYGDFRLHPRDILDLQSATSAFVLSIDDQYIYTSELFEIPVQLSILNQNSDVNSYQLQIEYNPYYMEYNGVNVNGTLSEIGVVEDLSSAGIVSLSFVGDFNFSDVQTLINLKFNPLNTGISELVFVDANINNIDINYIQAGNISINFSSLEIGDTLTVIQRPILNIPEIVIPGEAFEITCMAPENTTEWEAEIIYGNIITPLEITDAIYNNNLQRWFLNAIVSQINIYELYDLKVTASGGVEDITRNAVQVIPQEKEDYYFVHITDTHLPTHYFYEDPQSIHDTSEMEDLRKVIRDVNLIRPEFVLITGDYINEGELEDFENRRNHTKSQRLLYEFEVPVYLVPGNHDLGGWDATPPPQGTSRNEWWRFFGWPWLKPNTGEFYYTQDYSFDYGPIHFIGLESYVNYDGYLFNVYGDESFIPTQLEWLDNDLLNASESQSQVLFYHMDFSDQLNLSSLGVEMALWGHIHDNSGSIFTTPYNLSTNSVCDYNSSYRVINVSGGTLTPNYTSNAGPEGENLNIEFFPANTGENDSVTAIIENQQSLDFYNGIVKFVMPKGNYNYVIDNGVLQQIDSTGNFSICYVGVNISANSELTVSVKAELVSSIRNNSDHNGITLYQNNPNPFNSETKIRINISTSEKINLSVYDISGNLIKTIIDKKLDAGFHIFNWDGKNDSGKQSSTQVYFCKLSTERGYSEIIQLLKL